ncbi:MAG: hypothetical protein AAF297_09690 [Planctomycetota bacterium]
MHSDRAARCAQISTAASLARSRGWRRAIAVGVLGLSVISGHASARALLQPAGQLSLTQDPSAELASPSLAEAAAVDTSASSSRPSLFDPWSPGEGLPTWRVRFEPSFAYFALSGDFKFPGGGAAGSTTLDFEDANLDSPRGTFAGELHFAKGKNRLTISGTGVSTSRTFVSQAALQLGPGPVLEGQTVSFSIEYETFSILGSHRVLSRAAGVVGDGVFDVAFAVDVVGGVRFHRVDAEGTPRGGFSGASANGAGLATVDELFFEPVVGTRVELTFAERFTVEGRTEVGGFSFGDRSSVSGNLVVSFTWRPVPRVGVQAGYRLTAFSLEAGEDQDRFEWDGAMAGLFWSVSLSF